MSHVGLDRRHSENVTEMYRIETMRTTLSGFILLLLLLMIAPSLRADGISISQSLDRTSVAFEDSARFEIVLNWNGPQSAYLFGQPLSPHISGLRVHGFSSSIMSTGEGDAEITTKAYRYTLVPTTSGVGRIEPVSISYVTWPDSIPGELVTEAMTVNVAPPRPAEPEHGSSVVWVVAVVVIAALVTAGVVVRRTRAKKPVEPVRTALQVFLDGLAGIRKEAGNDLKEFQTRLYLIMSEFLSAQYSINVDSLSEDELQGALDETGMSREVKMKVAGYLLTARRDKFRPVTTAPGDTIRLETEIRDLFEKI